MLHDTSKESGQSRNPMLGTVEQRLPYLYGAANSVFQEVLRWDPKAAIEGDQDYLTAISSQPSREEATKPEVGVDVGAKAVQEALQQPNMLDAEDDESIFSTTHLDSESNEEVSYGIAA